MGGEGLFEGYLLIAKDEIHGTVHAKVFGRMMMYQVFNTIVGICYLSSEHSYLRWLLTVGQP